MLLRKKKLRKANFKDTDLDPDQNEIENLVDWSTNPAADVHNEEIKLRINEAMDTLKEKYKTVFVLRDIEGLSTRDAAQVLDITEENVKIRLLRARQYLRNYLSEYFEEKMVGAHGK
jgi:RNA polymerase sigma-70 factor (ECF subfamily)